MRFWDTSALVPLLVEESESHTVDALIREDGVVIAWWGTEVECLSALLRKRKDGFLDTEGFNQAVDRLVVILQHRVEILPSNRLRLRAQFSMIYYELKAADALQLAAALVWRRNRRAGTRFVSLDRGLRRAAEREGFRVVPEAFPSERAN